MNEAKYREIILKLADVGKDIGLVVGNEYNADKNAMFMYLRHTGHILGDIFNNEQEILGQKNKKQQENKIIQP